MAARMATDQNSTEGQQAILDDTQSLLNWFGVDSLDTWFNLDFEEKRAYHEKFAEGFEKYLASGKAPSLELQTLFQRFRAWIVGVYKSLQNLNVELTLEVKAVMDRMIASDEQIKIAQQARSMMPLFETAEKAGMTPEAFARYQQLGEVSLGDEVGSIQVLSDSTNQVSPPSSPNGKIIPSQLTGKVNNDASKVVDENGEPLVVYHGTEKGLCRIAQVT